MLDVQNENLLTLREAADGLPGRAGSVHPSTLHRWAAGGVAGAKLETVRIGGCRYTTAQAIERFILACSGSGASSTPSVATEKQIARAERECDALGV